MIALQVLQAVSLAPWLLLAGLAVMAFDAPGSPEKWQPWAFVLAIWSYPLWLLAASATAWMCYAFGKRRTALGITIAFALPVVAVALWAIIISML